MGTKSRYLITKISKRGLMATGFSFLIAFAVVSGVGINSKGVAAAGSCRISDRGLNEASGLVASVKHPGIVYTHNDEGSGKGKGLIFAVNASTCGVVAKLTIVGLRDDPDPEAITIDRTTGKIWFGDIGNGHPGQPSSMTDKKKSLKYPSLPARIVIFDEPARLSGSITITGAKKVNITYQGGMQNSEALLVNPKTGQGYIINKQATSTVYRLPNPLNSGTALNTGVKISQWVTDATFSNDGKWIFVRYRTATNPAPRDVLVYDAAWKYKGRLAVPAVQQGESITTGRDGKSLIVGSEGTNSLLAQASLGVYAVVPALVISGDAIPGIISEVVCVNLDRKVLTGDGKKYCAKRTDTKAEAPECKDMPDSSYAKLTYIKHSTGDYCGYL